MNNNHHRRGLWLEALGKKSVVLRALKMGFTTGLLQAAVNQGDRWLSHTADGVVLAKTIVSPLIGFTLVLLSAAATWVERVAAAETAGAAPTSSRQTDRTPAT